MINWPQILVEAGVTLGPVLLMGYLAYRKLTWTLGEFRPHRHQEKHGQLQASGIVYPRSMNGD